MGFVKDGSGKREWGGWFLWMHHYFLYMDIWIRVGWNEGLGSKHKWKEWSYQKEQNVRTFRKRNTSLISKLSKGMKFQTK